MLYEEGYIPTETPRRWQCMLSKVDALASHILIVDLDGIDDDELDLDDNVLSGVTSLFVEGSQIIPSENKIIIPKNSKRTLEVAQEAATRQRKLSNTPSVNSVVAVRVIANDTSTTSSMEELRDNIFYDEVNLRTQYDACSYGHTKMEPFNGTTSTGYDVDRGVVEVTIADNVSGKSLRTIQNAASSQASTLLGDLPSQFDHVMLCLVSCIIR